MMESLWMFLGKMCIPSSLGNGLHNILHLMDLLQILLLTSVLNEKAFNQMKLLKTDREL